MASRRLARYAGVALVLVALGAASCGPAASGPLPRPLRLVRADLAKRMHLPADRVRVVAAKRVKWPDTCLGLPSPEMCAQHVTPGYRVTLAARGQRCIYHTDLDSTFRYARPAVLKPRPGRCGH